jgi:hypothetical protein
MKAKADSRWGSERMIAAYAGGKRTNSETVDHCLSTCSVRLVDIRTYRDQGIRRIQLWALCGEESDDDDAPKLKAARQHDVLTGTSDFSWKTRELTSAINTEYRILRTKVPAWSRVAIDLRGGDGGSEAIGRRPRSCEQGIVQWFVGQA